MSSGNGGELMTFGGHLAVLRRTAIRIACVAGVCTVAVFCCKDLVWQVLLAPKAWDFVTYRAVETIAHAVGFTNYHASAFSVDLIATDLASQFLTHITTAISVGCLITSPYILYELFRFIAPALYDNERRYSVALISTVYLLFIIGLLMNYFVLFPISFRFLGTYSVSPEIHSTITITSYIHTFTSLALMMGLVFQLPVVTVILCRRGIVNHDLLATYRKHALIVILLVAAVITPPDVVTLAIVTLPLYLLYELSLALTRKTT